MMTDDDNDGQMIFGDLGGRKLPDICLAGEEKPRKHLTQETCPDRGSNPGPLRDRRACYRLPHNAEIFYVNHSVLPKGRSSTANSAFSTLPSSQPSFWYIHIVHLSSIIWYLLLPRTLFTCTILSRASFSRQFLLRKWPSQFLFLFQHYSSFSHSF